MVPNFSSSDAVAAAWGVVVAAVVFLLAFAFTSPSRATPAGFYSSPRRFLVTGAASGIARHLVKRLCRDGHKVFATDVDKKGLLSLRDEISSESGRNSWQLVIQTLDVTNSQHWTQAIDSIKEMWGGADVVLNIAGYLYPSRIQDVRPQDIDRHIDINVKGVIHGTHAATQLMLEQKRSGDDSSFHIINFSSLGALAPVQGVTMYLASKYAVRGFSLAASKDLTSSGIYVTCVCPDAVCTPMLDLQLHFEASAMAYSGAMLSVEDVASVVMDKVLPQRPVEVWSEWLVSIFWHVTMCF